MAAPATPKTWLAGDTLSADDLNTHVRDPLAFLLNRPMVRVDTTGLTNGTHNVIANQTYTDVTFNTEQADPDDMWDSGLPKRLSVPAGFPDSWWRVGAQVMMVAATSSGSRHILRVLKNGSTGMVEQHGSWPSVSATATLSLSGLVRLSAGDYLTVQVWQGTGADRSVNNSLNTWADLVWERFA